MKPPSWVGLRLMARRAGAADAALDLADREAGAEFVALTRSTERREHDRLLHDTVLNTLTALARGGDSSAAEVRARCRHDVTLMEYALRDTGAADEEALGPCGGLVIGIVQQMSTLVLPYQLQNTAIFVVFLLIIFLRPQGMFGRLSERT